MPCDQRQGPTDADLYLPLARIFRPEPYAVVSDSREVDEFRRIELTARPARDREVVTQYEAGLEFYRRRVEDTQYDLGRLDERLGGERR